MFENGSLSGDAVVDPIVSFGELHTRFVKVMASPEGGIKLGCVFA
jgi:hypothetical protein